MKFLSTRELRNRPGYVRKLVQKEDLVLTANGKPVALMLGTSEDDFEETALVIRQARAIRAVARMRKHAATLPPEVKSPSAIEAEIRAVRAKRKTK
jgi:PHD/YefM family antitoxin component YafN of YafNO toxin-antitoxin module